MWVCVWKKNSIKIGQVVRVLKRKSIEKSKRSKFISLVQVRPISLAHLTFMCGVFNRVTRSLYIHVIHLKHLKNVLHFADIISLPIDIPFMYKKKCKKKLIYEEAISYNTTMKIHPTLYITSVVTLVHKNILHQYNLLQGSKACYFTISIQCSTSKHLYKPNINKFTVIFVECMYISSDLWNANKISSCWISCDIAFGKAELNIKYIIMYTANNIINMTVLGYV